MDGTLKNRIVFDEGIELEPAKVGWFKNKDTGEAVFTSLEAAAKMDKPAGTWVAEISATRLKEIWDKEG